MAGGGDAARRASTAFLVEAMVLLVFLAASLAVLTRLFAASVETSASSLEMTRAVTVASSAAEGFAADPASLPSSFERDGMRVECDVAAEDTGAGTLWQADIVVLGQEGDPVYGLRTARYVPGGGPEGRAER